MRSYFPQHHKVQFVLTRSLCWLETSGQLSAIPRSLQQSTHYNMTFSRECLPRLM